MRLGPCLTVLLLIVFAACGSESTPPTATAVPEPSPVATPTPEPTPAPVPTPTPTRVPTATPHPNPTATPAPVIIRSTREESEGPASDFTISRFDGGELTLSELQGSVVVLNFWASWCLPCRQEMPAFESIYQEYKDRGVVFVGVAVSDVESEARAFAELMGVSYPLGMDSTGEIAEAYQIQALPTTYFIDQEGTITKKITGLANEGTLRIFLSSRVR